MKHFASPKFWTAYQALPLPVQKLADGNYELLKRDPRHPSLQFKKVGALLVRQGGASVPRSRR